MATAVTADFVEETASSIPLEVPGNDARYSLYTPFAPHAPKLSRCFRFSVQGPGSAHVVLSESMDARPKDAYEIVLGPLFFTMYRF
jgi:hypothetical protein